MLQKVMCAKDAKVMNDVYQPSVSTCPIHNRTPIDVTTSLT